MKETLPKFIYTATVIAGALLLLLPAFYNGYPIANPDTNTYMISGFTLETPFDRPIMYGLLLRLFSLNGVSLWFTVFFQALIVSWLLSRLVKNFSNRKHYLFYFLLIILFLSSCTGLSWVASELIADIYTPIAVLCVIVLLINKESKPVTVLLYVLYFVSVASHISHVIIFAVLLVLLLLLRKYVFTTVRQAKTALLLLLLTAATIATMGSALSKAKHAFFIASMLEKGVLKKYLDEQCTQKNYKLCRYKDSLPVSDVFLWDASSPLYKEGGWKAVKPEYDAIIHEVLWTPRYALLFAKESIVFTGRQLCFFIIGEGNINVSNVYPSITRFVPHELKAFDTSRQNEWKLLDHINTVNRFFNIIVVLSIIIILMALVVKRRQFSKQMLLVVVIIIAAIVINAWDCATFSNVVGRYQCRVVWLLPFLATLLVLVRRQESNNPPNTL